MKYSLQPTSRIHKTYCASFANLRQVVDSQIWPQNNVVAEKFQSGVPDRGLSVSQSRLDSQPYVVLLQVSAEFRLPLRTHSTKNIGVFRHNLTEALQRS